VTRPDLSRAILALPEVCANEAWRALGYIPSIDAIDREEEAVGRLILVHHLPGSKAAARATQPMIERAETLWDLLLKGNT
jgi:hypothetical protein